MFRLPLYIHSTVLLKNLLRVHFHMMLKHNNNHCFHLSSPPVFSGVRVTRSFVLYVCFVDRWLSFCTFSLAVLCFLFFDIRILIAPLVSSNSSYSCKIIFPLPFLPCVITNRSDSLTTSKMVHFAVRDGIHNEMLPKMIPGFTQQNVNNNINKLDWTKYSGT